MSYSFTSTETRTFTVTHARHLAAKVSADLKRMQRLYGYPSNERIEQFEGEVIELLRLGYMASVTYGFRQDEKWVEPTLRYTASEFASGNTDDDPGRIPIGKDVSKASFHSFLNYSDAWWKLSEDERDRIKRSLPLYRTSGTEPDVRNGYFADDKTYYSGGRALGRSTVRSY